MASNAFEQCICGVRHVTVVAHAAGRTGLVMGMFTDPIREVSVTLKTGLIPIDLQAQLVIRVAIIVHGVT